MQSAGELKWQQGAGKIKLRARLGGFTFTTCDDNKDSQDTGGTIGREDRVLGRQSSQGKEHTKEKRAQRA